MIVADSTKQKINARSLRESQFIVVDDIIRKIFWTQLFLGFQGFKVKVNIIYQDNTSTMKLQNNGKASSGKRKQQYDIKYFYVTDLIGRDEVQVIYCPTNYMVGDYMTKPLVGSRFVKFRYLIVNLSKRYHQVCQQECVGGLRKQYLLKYKSESKYERLTQI